MVGGPPEHPGIGNRQGTEQHAAERREGEHPRLAPDGDALFARLDGEGKIDSVAKWWDGEIAKLDLSYAGIVALANKAWESVGATDVFSPAKAWSEKIKPIFEPTVKRVWEFIKAVGAKILAVVKDLVLKSLADWAKRWAVGMSSSIWGR